MTRASGLVLLAALLLLGGLGSGCSGGRTSFDLSVPVDATVARDLAEAPDLAVEVVDLATPPDLATPRDLRVAPDLTAADCRSGVPCPPQTECCMFGVRAGNCYNPACLACCM